MNIRIAILAACASTLVLAAPTGAFAQRGSEVIPGIDVVVRKECYDSQGRRIDCKGAVSLKQPKAGSRLPNKKVGTARKTLPKSEARPGSKIGDTESPRPTDRKILTGAGAGAGPHRR